MPKITTEKEDLPEKETTTDDNEEAEILQLKKHQNEIISSNHMWDSSAA